jgi:hypothetical protein
LKGYFRAFIRIPKMVGSREDDCSLEEAMGAEESG